MMGDVLNTQQCVVLGHTFASGWSTCLDLANTQSNNEICDNSILGFTATVGDHDAPTIGLRKLCTGIEGISAKSLMGIQ